MVKQQMVKVLCEGPKRTRLTRALVQCVAGQPAVFAIEARDRHGHAVRSGGPGFLVEVTAGSERVQGA